MAFIYRKGIWRPNQVPVGPVELDRSHPLAQGLVGLWPLGVDARDYSGFGHVGTLGSTTASQPSARGLVFKFDGTAASAITTADVLNSPATLSISAWINPAALVSNLANICSNRTSGNKGWSFALYGTPSAVSFTIQGVAQYLSTSTFAEIGVWNQVGMTWSGNSVIFFLNGRQLGTAVATGALSGPGSGMVLGGQGPTSAPASVLSGLLSSVEIFNANLSPDVMASLAAEPFAMLRPKVRRSYYTASGGGGTSVTGSLSETWPDVSASASAAAVLGHPSSLSEAIADWTPAMAAFLGHPATVAETWTDWPRSAAAVLGHVASASDAIPAWASAASAALGHAGSISETIAPWSDSASAALGHSASAADIWPAWIISASATLGSATITGSLAETWADFASSAQAVLGHPASSSDALPDWSIASVAALGHGASIDDVWPGWRSSSAGSVLGNLLGASGVVGRLQTIGGIGSPQAIGGVAKRQNLGGIGKIGMARTNDLEGVSPDAGGTRYIDFGPILQQLMAALGTTGLTLSAATVACSVATGSNVPDPNAAALVPGAPTLLASPANQAPSSAVFFDIAAGGVSGAIYKAVVLGTRSDNGKQIELFAHFPCASPY